VKRECMTRLESFMVPRDVVFVPELPKTATAKVSKRLLRAMPVGIVPASRAPIPIAPAI